jgi:hypothetical protein
MRRASVLALLATVLHPAHAATTVLLDSQTGDYIGLGARATFAAPAWTITHEATQTLVRITMNDGDQSWSLDFQVPRGADFTQLGQHAGAVRWPFNAPTVPGLSVSGDGRGCNTLEGWFEVLEGSFTETGELLALAIDFKQNCDNSASALYGSVRIDSAIPLELPGPKAVAGRDRLVYGLDTVVLDGRQSFDRDRDSLTYAWTQLAGPPVELRGALGALADFLAPYAPPGGDDYLFELTVSDPGGNTATDTVAVEVRSMSDAQTYVLFSSDAGHYIGQGRTFRMTPIDGDVFSEFRSDGSVSVVFSGASAYHMEFSPTTVGALAPGPYEDTRRFADADHPGLDIGGDGRGCNSATGRFDLRQLVVVGGDVARFGADFEHHCEDTEPVLRGEVRFNYVPAGLPQANAGSDQEVGLGAPVRLTAGASDDGGIAAYQWRQLAGPPIELSGADTPTPSFTAPAGPGAQTIELQLVVADDEGHTAADTVSVTATDGAAGGSGAMPRALLLLALLAAVCRRRLRT